MSYKLYTDKQEIFECKISLEGASLTKATSRIIVDTDNLKLMFEGTIDKNGNCKVPIKKLRGLIDEDSKGTMKLEVIAEDTYFNPWESDFEVDTSKKIKVEVKQQDKPLVENSKPKMVIEKVKHPFEPVNSIVDLKIRQNFLLFGYSDAVEKWYIFCVQGLSNLCGLNAVSLEFQLDDVRNR